jgi:UDP-N-acetylmuramyl tripeptide synthase
MTEAEAPEYPSPLILSSRRLTGANWYSRLPGAVIDVRVDNETARRVTDHWPYEARAIATALGWNGCDYLARHGLGDAACFLSAPLDGLMTATVAAEQAWVRAEAYVAAQDGDLRTSEDPVPALRAMYAEERASLAAARTMIDVAVQHGLSWHWDDEQLTIGSGRGSETWPLASVPAPDQVQWARRYDVPTVLVTGSNGKTTTTRLIAAMFRASGRETGWSCSDGVWVSDATGPRELAAGDYTGPAGARLVLADQRVAGAVLETARGGILRRGLATTRARVACITNISFDHLGEYGVTSLRDLAEVKSVVATTLDVQGRLVLNADDPTLVAHAKTLSPDVPVVWFSMDPGSPQVMAGVAAWGDGAVCCEGHLMIASDGVWNDAGPMRAMPITLHGAALHNVMNAMAAALSAMCAGVALDDVYAVLQHFGREVDDNAGRLRRWDIGGVKAIVDYAHNPAGLTALLQTARAIEAPRRLLVLGQAGDRDNAQLQALAASAWDAVHFDRIIIKEMETMWRGRTAGEVPAVFTAAFAALGVPDGVVSTAPSEIDAVREALAWARAGDLLLLPTHVSKPEVGALLERLKETGWEAGQALPER